MNDKTDMVYVPMDIKQYIKYLYKENALKYAFDDKTILVISIDEYDVNPRKYDENLWTIVFFLKDYEIGDYEWKRDHGIKYSNDLKEYLHDYYGSNHDYILIGLNFHDYNYYGQIEKIRIIDVDDIGEYSGYAFVYKKDVIKYIGNEKEIMLDLLNDDTLINKAINILNKEIQKLNCYLHNEVYSFTLIDRNTLDIIDDMHGFYCNNIKSMKDYVHPQYQHLFYELKDVEE